MRRGSESDREFKTRLKLATLICTLVILPVPLYFAIVLGRWMVLVGALVVVGYVALLSGLMTVPHFILGWGSRASVLLVTGAALVVTGFVMILFLQVPSGVAIAFPLVAGSAVIALAYVMRNRP